MTSHAHYEPLRAVPPVVETQRRFALALWLREQSRRAYDAILTAPRRAAGYAARLAERLHLDGALAWLRVRATRLGRPLLRLSNRLGTSGMLAAATVVVTSQRGQHALKQTARTAGRLLGWIGGRVYRLLDVGLRLFGQPGNRAADALLDAVVAVGGRAAVVARRVAHRVARLSDPTSSPVRVVAGLARGYLLHRVLKLVIRNPFVRLVVEGLVSAFTVDTRVGEWLRSVWRQLRIRYASLRAQTRATAATEGPDTGRRGRQQPASGSAPRDRYLAMPEWMPDAVEDEQDLRPNNRAERRLQQREQGRKKNRPNP